MSYNDYMYAVDRSDEYLAHYGIKGMKWGVQKARDVMLRDKQAGARKLARQYKKAMKKLDKLNKNADAQYQVNKALKNSKQAKLGLGIGLTGAAIGGVPLAKEISKLSKINSAQERFNRNQIIFTPNGPIRDGAADLVKAKDDYSKGSPILRQILGGVGGGMAAGGLGSAAVYGIKAARARHKASGSGHAKAVAERNEFQREMNKAFAGTKYGRNRKRRN